MDADFSHDPNAIPRFLERIRDADLVIGSRYVEGVTVVNWPLSRLILSISANIYTRVATGMPLHDATGGFKCFRREVLAALPLDQIKSDGYSFQIEMNFHAWKRGFRIVEIPIVFTDRLVGASKMSRRIIWEAAFMVWKLRFASLRRRIP
jgi:dolichol-phosphate mannosyltransferase